MLGIYTFPDGKIAVCMGGDGANGNVVSVMPADAINPRHITGADIPEEFNEFFDAWRDVLPGTQIDICMATAKEIALASLRKAQEDRLAALGTKASQAMLDDDQEALKSIKAQYALIKDAHKALETLEVSGYNDYDTLRKIQALVKLPEIVG